MTYGLSHAKPHLRTRWEIWERTGSCYFSKYITDTQPLQYHFSAVTVTINIQNRTKYTDL